ncbi:MAG: CaiB/BaiF CoA-transferase family protein [Anaerolineae bacterium]|nr:CaiB/BaiF CoA-transferase family protein [Anaerolineae bacterium]
MMKALQGIRVIDLTHMISGPYAGLLLADLGTESIKVEPPKTGEMTRQIHANNPQYSIDGMGAYFLTVNRNKKSLTINLKTEEGLALFYDLVKISDVVLSNFSVGVTAKLKIDYDHLSAINPRIITCAISGFGEDGPGAKRPAYDMVAQAISGAMSVTGHPDSPPTRAGIPYADLCGGMMGVIGILSAVIARQSTGKGQHVDISMQDTQISALNYLATMYLLSGKIPEQLGNAHLAHIPYNTFATQDGYIVVAVIPDVFWLNLMTVVDAPDINTEENKTRPGRYKNRDSINQCLSDIFLTNTQAFWIERLENARIPCAPVNNVAQALNDVQVAARNMVVEVEHPNGTTYHAPGNPVKMSDTYEDSFSPPPLLGQHTDEILKDLLGKSDEEIATWRSNGII